ncbi:MAG: hypothetical protein O3A80_04760 [bacterium]|nr:hypothetical protein [bacterium]MDA1292946.1 hypothetical protein [bacterium]
MPRSWIQITAIISLTVSIYIIALHGQFMNTEKYFRSSIAYDPMLQELK